MNNFPDPLRLSIGGRDNSRSRRNSALNARALISARDQPFITDAGEAKKSAAKSTEALRGIMNHLPDLCPMDAATLMTMLRSQIQAPGLAVNPFENPRMFPKQRRNQSGSPLHREPRGSPKPRLINPPKPEKKQHYFLDPEHLNPYPNDPRNPIMK